MFRPLIIRSVLILTPVLIANAQAGRGDANSIEPKVLAMTGINTLHQLKTGFTGRNIHIGVLARSFNYEGAMPLNDYRPAADHNCFKGVDFTFTNEGNASPDFSPHTTAVCSLLFGYDPDANVPGFGRFEYFGIAPEAFADVYEFRSFVSDFIYSQQVLSLDVLSISLGSQFEDWWTRGICALAEQTGLPVVAAIGNGSTVQDPVLFPGGSANVIGVGVADINETDPNIMTVSPQHSSYGTPNGRIKPDIVAPGRCLVAVSGQAAQYTMTGNWSSFSTPLVAGSIALLKEAAKLDPNLWPKDPNCVLKAVVLNSARKLANWHRGDANAVNEHQWPLDFVQGAGMLDCERAYVQFIAGRQESGEVNSIGWDSAEIDLKAGQQKMYVIKPAGAEPNMITATLAWNRHFERQYPFKPIADKDSDLRLELWGVGKSSQLELIDYSDSPTDNVEHIHSSPADKYTYYMLLVKAGDANPVTAKGEHYALAWNFGSK